MLSQRDGNTAVRLAREAATAAAARKPLPAPPEAPAFREPRGAFVTLKEGGLLRGCIGRPEADQPFGRAVVESAAAATRDPRLEPVEAGEMARISVEVTRLGPLEPVAGSRLDLPRKVVVGEHGLVIRRDLRAGLLLPQVAVEHGWDAEEFLCQACAKAGLPMDAWLVAGTRVFAFRGQVFGEAGPGGPVREVRLRENGRSR
ncbi:MAG: AmmeMemoRadiSam system protein A [Halobacteria archaeon]